jgi:hypothetical protein
MTVLLGAGIAAPAGASHATWNAQTPPQDDPMARGYIEPIYLVYSTSNGLAQSPGKSPAEQDARTHMKPGGWV